MESPIQERVWTSAQGAVVSGSPTSLERALRDTRSASGYVLPFPVVWGARIALGAGAALLKASDYDGQRYRGRDEQLLEDVLLTPEGVSLRMSALVPAEPGPGMRASVLGRLAAHLWTGRSTKCANLERLRPGVPEGLQQAVAWMLCSTNSKADLVDACVVLKSALAGTRWEPPVATRDPLRPGSSERQHLSRAVEEAHRAASRFPNSCRAWIQLAVLWSSLGLESAAAFAWSEALCAARGHRTILLAIQGFLRLPGRQRFSDYFERNGHACVADWIRDTAIIN